MTPLDLRRLHARLLAARGYGDRRRNRADEQWWPHLLVPRHRHNLRPRYPEGPFPALRRPRMEERVQLRDANSLVPRGDYVAEQTEHLDVPERLGCRVGLESE